MTNDEEHSTGVTISGDLARYAMGSLTFAPHGYGTKVVTIAPPPEVRVEKRHQPLRLVLDSIALILWVLTLSYLLVPGLWS